MSTSTLLTTDVPQVLLAEHWDGPGAWWPIFPIMWLLFWAGVVTLFVVFGRRYRWRSGAHAGESKLAERFAAGEITEQEYRERRAVLRERDR